MDERRLEIIKRLSWGDIKKNLAGKVPFEAISPMGSMLIHIREYAPVIAVMPHTGHRVREEITSKMSIEEDARMTDEDPALAPLIEAFPIQIYALDSRYEYDVDRARPEAIYLKPFQSWGKKVWVNPPSKEEIDVSLQKYDEFHDLLEFFVDEALQWKSKAVVLCLDGVTPRPGSKVATPYQLDLDIAHVDATQHAKPLSAFTDALRAASPTMAVNGGSKPAQVLAKKLCAKPGTFVAAVGVGRPVATLPTPAAIQSALYKGAQSALELF